MKKILLVAAIIGLIAVPSFVVARNQADDKNRQENTQKAEDNQPAADQPINGDITQEQAVDIASKQVPGKTLKKVEIETEEGTKVYSVRFTDDTRVDVRASDGTIVRVNKDSKIKADTSGTSGGSNSKADY